MFTQSLMFLIAMLSAPTVQERLAAADIPDVDVVVAHHQVHTTVAATGASTVVEKKLYKIQTAKGAAQLTVLRFDVDPNTNAVDVESIRACWPNGSCTMIKPRVDLVPQPAGWILWRFFMKIVTIPALEPGMGLEVTTKKRGFLIAYLGEGSEDEFVPPMKGHFYDQILFGEDPYPVVEKEYILVMPTAMRMHVREYNGPISSSSSYTPQTTTHRWVMRDLPALEREPMMPFESDSLPKIVLATVPDWHAKSRWFYEVNERQFEPTPEIRAKVTELLRGVTSREQKLAILTRWVANNIRYRGFSMGKSEGYVLHTGAQVFEERAGVCKDIASMLVTMARAAGFTVYPAMTMAGARVEEEPADQFNHSVVAVKNDDGTFTMLDPTWAPLDRYVWSPAESEQHYVVGTPGGRKLEMIPASKPADNLLRLVVSTRFKDANTLLLKSRIEGRGTTDSQLRRAIGYAPVAERDLLGIEFARRLSPAAKTMRFTWTDPWKFDTFVSFSAEVETPSTYYDVDRKFVWSPLALRALPEFDRLLPWLQLKANPVRRHPVLLRSNIVVELEETFESARPLAVIHLPATAPIKTAAAELFWKVTVEPRRIRFTATLTLPSRRVTAAQYASFVDTIAAFVRLDKLRVQLEVGR